MKKEKVDLSEQRYADQSKNTTAMIGIYIMNIILAIAYLIELLKGARTPQSYVLVLCLCFIPCLISMFLYFRKQDSFFIRYVLGIGFLALYGYIMFTSTTNVVFCYIIVAFVLLVIYVDIKFLAFMGVTALIINIANTVNLINSGKFDAIALTNTEIIFACLILTGAFTIMATRKIEKINNAHIAKATKEKKLSEELLQKTLKVAMDITENILKVVEQTEQLKDATDTTKQAMEGLSSGANTAAEAMVEQKQSTELINQHIYNVEEAVNFILREIDTAQENLQQGNLVMNDLLHQVKISETSGNEVAKKVSALKEYAAKMKDIMGLISSVANQTGLLALNASIEAARAGEAGRGFSVVASEISNLSSQTNHATGDINDLISNIVKAIEEVSQATELLLESSRLQNGYVNNTAENFEKIHSSTQGIVTQASHLKETVDIVTDANKQIEEKIEHVYSVTEEVTAGAEETLDECNRNLESVNKVVIIMEYLKEDANKLQNEGR